MSYRAASDESFAGITCHLLCRDAAMMGLRHALESKGIQEIKRMGQAGGGKIADNPVSMRDFEQALGNTQPSVDSAQMKRFEKWTEEFGSGN